MVIANDATQLVPRPPEIKNRLNQLFKEVAALRSLLRASRKIYGDEDIYGPSAGQQRSGPVAASS